MLIAGRLARLVGGKVVLDLNCGSAPLLHYLPRTFLRYVGNDIDAMALQAARLACPLAEFLECPDDALPNLGQVDILLCLGYAAALNCRESQTLDASVRQVVIEYCPEMVVLDVWMGVPVYPDFVALVLWIGQQGYAPSGWLVSPLSAVDDRQRRAVYFLERVGSR
jgi:SAM-dependent methyltransferase